MSYSISPLSQLLIKKVAEEAGATQGSIVESSPLLFGKIVLDSLERRSRSIENLRIFHKQIRASLKAFSDIAPHLKPYTDQVGKMIDEILEMEEKAVAGKNYQGVDSSDFQSLNSLKTSGEAPPYNKEIENFLGDNELLISLFKRYQD